jgi:hypothetical protein
MKLYLIAIILLGNFFAAQAQKSITINVEDLKKPAKKMRVDSYQTILKDMITLDSTNAEDLARGKKIIEPKFNIVAKNNISYGLVNLGYHPFFEGMYHAYAEHRPFNLSPDMIWLLICQGFSQHVNNNSESMRHFFVDFKGKVSLVVRNDKISLDDPNSPWQDVFSNFSKQISDNTGKQLTETLTADFSTTTLTSKMASQITLMDAMKSYFDFVVITIGCGIPKITLEGTEQDWQGLLIKTEALRKYNLDWWVDKMEPALKKIIEASQGKINQQFWQGMFKYHSKGACGPPAIADGWIVNFFPYDKYGKRNNLDSISMKDVLPNEIVKVDLRYERGDGRGNFVTTPLELWAGFVGLRQNDKTFELKPEIGWMIRKKGIVNNEKIITQLKAENSTANSPMGSPPEGIRIRVKTVPKELFEIGPIHSLVIFFVDGIQIPDAMGKIKIEKLEVYGKVDEAGIDRICKLFPNITIRINDKQYADGKSYDEF